MVKWPTGCAHKLLIAICVAFVLKSAHAATPSPTDHIEQATFDLRTHPEGKPYGVSFAAADGEAGHAFVIWGREDDQRRMSWETASGFYPVGHNITALFGAKGRILQDSNTNWSKRVNFLVNTETYEKARAVNDNWKEGTSYVLGFNDCTSFVGSVASSIGLSPPVRAFYPLPSAYVKAILNEQLEIRAQDNERRANQARENAARAQRMVDAARRRKETEQFEMALALSNRAMRAADQIESEIERYDKAATRQQEAREHYVQEAHKWDEKAKQIRLRMSLP